MTSALFLLMDCTQAINFILKVLQILVTLSIGVATGLMAKRQYDLAKHKVKIDLYDRRYKVYDAARKLLSRIMTVGECQDLDLVDYLIGTSDCSFLFPKETVEYLDNLRLRALDLRSRKFAYLNIGQGELREKLVQQEHEAFKALNDELNLLRSRFSKELNIHEFD